MLTDNGAEVASRRNAAGQPLERLLEELGIKHRYTRPYRTLNEDLLDGTTFETVEELKDESALYLLYSDTERRR